MNKWTKRKYEKVELYTPPCKDNVEFPVGSRTTILSRRGLTQYKQINQILDEIRIISFNNY